ncbi:MAG TPA: CBS domain-containing protein [Nitrososphaeraceae archaeon]|nr:CBS domain-containing protein [Nitrososphaeraceae archaeon]
MTITVNDMMTRELETIEESSSIQDAARKMRDTNVSSLVVVDSEGKPHGIVTERDIVRKACVNDISTNRVTTREIMSPKLITIGPDSSAPTAIDMMLRNNIRHLLVVDKYDTEKPIGMITPLDLRDEEFTDQGLIDAIEELSMYYK